MAGQKGNRNSAGDRDPAPAAGSPRSRSRSKDDFDAEPDDDGRAPLDFEEDDPLDRRKDPLRR
jgi:hypothetical protein